MRPPVRAGLVAGIGTSPEIRPMAASTHGMTA